MDVERTYRHPIFLEACYLATFLLLGVGGVIFGDDVGRGIGLVCLVLALPVAFFMVRKSRLRLYLYADSLLIKGTSIAWTDVAHVRAWTTKMYKVDGPPESFYRCILHLHDGRVVNLAAPPYVDGVDLAETVVRRVAAIMLPVKLAELESQGAVAFGPITVTSEGITDSRHFAAWPTLTRVDCGRVRLRIWAGAGRPVISRQVRTIPDVSILLHLIATRAR